MKLVCCQPFFSNASTSTIPITVSSLSRGRNDDDGAVPAFRWLSEISNEKRLCSQDSRMMPNRQLTHRTVRTQDFPDFWVLGGLRAIRNLSQMAHWGL